MSIPRELIEQIQRGNLVFFIGAGLSIGAGLPNWSELIQPLAKEIDYSGDNLLKAAQYYENRRGRHALIAYLRDRLDTTAVSLTNSYKLLAQLPVNIVFTTNFDNLLERAYRSNGKTINLVIGVSELPYWDESRVNLVKLHGSSEYPASIIITEHDFNTIYRSKSLILQQLNALLVTKTFCFIGYSLNDPDFNQIYDQLGFELRKHQRSPYLVTFGLDDFQAEDLSRRGYHLISVPDHGDRNIELEQWLLELLSSI